MEQTNNTTKYFIIAVVVVSVIFAGTLFFSKSETQNEQDNSLGGERDRTKIAENVFQVELLSATTSRAATSGPFLLGGAKRATLFFAEGGAVSGSSTDFSIWVGGVRPGDAGLASTDNLGDHVVQYNKLISNVTNTNSQQLTRIGSVNVAGNATTTVSMDLTIDIFSFLVCVASSSASAGNPSNVYCSVIVEK